MKKVVKPKKQDKPMKPGKKNKESMSHVSEKRIKDYGDKKKRKDIY